MKAFFRVRLSMKQKKIWTELYFGKKCGFLSIRLVISAITKCARSSGFWWCCYGNSEAIGLISLTLNYITLQKDLRRILSNDFDGNIVNPQEAFGEMEIKARERSLVRSLTLAVISDGWSGFWVKSPIGTWSAMQ